jgi:hypothetical protein
MAAREGIMPLIERFFHIRPLSYTDSGNLPMNNGGATVRVMGSTDEDWVTVQVTYCSKKDPFCRKLGRMNARFEGWEPNAKIITVREGKRIGKGELPDFLQTVARNVARHVLKLSLTKAKDHHLWGTDYKFAVRYFTKKAVTA